MLPPTPFFSAPSSRRLTETQAGSCNVDGVSWVVAIPRVPEEGSNYSSSKAFLRHTGVWVSAGGTVGATIRSRLKDIPRLDKFE